MHLTRASVSEARLWGGKTDAIKIELAMAVILLKFPDAILSNSFTRSGYAFFEEKEMKRILFVETCDGGKGYIPYIHELKQITKDEILGANSDQFTRILARGVIL